MLNDYSKAGIKSLGPGETLLENLGVEHYTMRHLRIINEFLESKETDLTKLLDKLGGWDSSDLAIAEEWFKNVER